MAEGDCARLPAFSRAYRRQHHSSAWSTHAYLIVLRFDSHDHLTAWIESDNRKRLLDRAKSLFLTAEELEIQTGLEYWFTPPFAL